MLGTHAQPEMTIIRNGDQIRNSCAALARPSFERFDRERGSELSRHHLCKDWRHVYFGTRRIEKLLSSPPESLIAPHSNLRFYPGATPEIKTPLAGT
jgi:hypothetical protein